MLAGKKKRKKKKGLASQICKRRQYSPDCTMVSSLRSIGYPG